MRAALALLALLPLIPQLVAQPTPPIPREGYVLEGDMMVPIDAPEFAWTGTLWPGGIVYYSFDANVNATNRARSREAMAEWAAVADLTFVERTNQPNYIRFNDSTVNSSYVGMIGGSQTLNMYNWSFKYIICHELAHALGFIHEQQRPDRGSYVTINTQNICCNAGSNFTIRSAATTVTPYDFLSIMHYGDGAFSNGGGNTITALPAYAQYQNQMGNRSYMTVHDAQGMAARYGPPPPPTISGTTPASVPAGTGNVTLTIAGTRFNKGPNGSNGVQGSRVHFDGVPMATSWLDPETLQVQVPASMLGTPGCYTVEVENPAPGGGFSAPYTFVVTGVQPPQTGAYTWTGAHPAGAFGAALLAVGDLDLDGQQDLAFGAPAAMGDQGEVLVVSGDDGTAIHTLTGTPNSRYGSALALVGDLDLDGRPEFAIGAPAHAGQGRVEVRRGSDGALVWARDGATNSAYGTTLAAGTDLDLDGVPDVVVGAPLDGLVGRIEALSGADGSVLWSATGSWLGERFGEALALGPDLDQDGHPEVAVGAPWNSNGGAYRGAVRVLSGADGTLRHEQTGSAPYERLGTSLAWTGDTDGDQVPDLAVGATEEGLGFLVPSGPGRVALYSGSGGAPPLWTRVGSSPEDAFGSALLTVGDVDRDGVPDLAVGAPGVASPAPTARASCTVLSGRDGRLLLQRGAPGADTQLGRALALGADRDADGRPELLIGAPGATTSCGPTGGVTWLSLRATPQPDRPLISEVWFGGPLAVEIRNHGSQPLSTTGWKLGVREQGAGGLALDQIVSLPAWTLAPGALAVLTSPGAVPQIAAGVPTATILPAPSSVFASLGVALFDPEDQLRDEVLLSFSTGLPQPPLFAPESFRGVAQRTLIPFTPSVERIGALDTDSGADWTAQAAPSLGWINTESGARGSDPLPATAPAIQIHEIDPQPGYVELLVTGTSPVDLQGHALVASAGNGAPPQLVRPWPETTSVAPGSYVVVGHGPPPAELPAGTSYVDLASLGEPPLSLGSGEPFSLGLYDGLGRVVDLLRAKSLDGFLEHHRPRLPGHRSDFRGVAGRAWNTGDQALGRLSPNDSDQGTDFAPVETRTMGGPNGGLTPIPDFSTGGELVARVAGGQGAFSFVLNGGAALANAPYELFFSPQPMGGFGPFYGLNPDAVVIWLTLSGFPPVSGTLDAEGSARFDLPVGTIPSLSVDLVFFAVDPQGGGVSRTMVIQHAP